MGSFRGMQILQRPPEYLSRVRATRFGSAGRDASIPSANLVMYALAAGLSSLLGDHQRTGAEGGASEDLVLSDTTKEI